MKETKEKLEITIVALGDSENEDNEDEDEKQTVLYNEIGNDANNGNKSSSIWKENNLSLQQLQEQLTITSFEGDELLLEDFLLPENSSINRESDATIYLSEEGLDSKGGDRMRSPLAKSFKARKVKFTDEVSRVRQPRLCETCKTSTVAAASPTFANVFLSNKPLTANELEKLRPISSKQDVTATRNHSQHQNRHLHSDCRDTNDESDYTSQRKRVPVKMRSVNMFNSVLPSTLLVKAVEVKAAKASFVPFTASKRGRSRVIPAWIKNKPHRSRNYNQCQSVEKVDCNCRITGITKSTNC